MHSTDGIALPNSQWVEIPEFGEHENIDRIYKRPNGDLVLNFSFRRAGKTLSDFYDARILSRSAPLQELQLAHDNGAVRKLVSDNQLKLVLPKPILALPGSITVIMGEFSGTTCQWPFAMTLDIQSAGQTRQSMMVFSKLLEPEHKKYERGCEGVSGSYSLSVRYRAEYVTLYEAASPGFYGVLSDAPILIHFDAAGSSKFFDGRSDVVLMPASAIEPIFVAANNGGRPQQSFVDEAQALIDARGRARGAK